MTCGFVNRHRDLRMAFGKFALKMYPLEREKLKTTANDRTRVLAGAALTITVESLEYHASHWDHSKKPKLLNNFVVTASTYYDSAGPSPACDLHQCLQSYIGGLNTQNAGSRFGSKSRKSQKPPTAAQTQTKSDLLPSVQPPRAGPSKLPGITNGTNVWKRACVVASNTNAYFGVTGHWIEELSPGEWIEH
ncbi:hypothetical protein CPB83DRAFT_840949 [Crepidotus variabilis]|uniref:Uncharacterized protein n=1 Tax=Crepidotus variabilis TaxID=179855 RepID=A0A9P6E3I3_9AGAR|nr:hypothetical protein CPB83DRAFT_840949 [Crepidotus variabilis]